MKSKNILGSFSAFLVIVLCSIFTTGATHKYRICVVEVLNKTHKATKFCPVLNDDDSKAECVIASNRLECLLKISEGKADFGVFGAEDIVVAANSKINNILVTNNIRFSPEKPFEYEVVAIVRKSADISKLSDLQGKNLCHSGYGYEPDWTDVISRFFEARVVPQICNSSLSLVENRIKSSASYFRAACKAGPWVPNLTIDTELKNKYPNLCELCDNPYICSTSDKYWGRRGPLYCLTDGVGDVSWARLDDTRSHFALNASGLPPVADHKDFSLLCPNGSLQPVDTPEPCAWLARPWPAVVAASEAANSVRQIVSNLTNLQARGWEWSLDRLMAQSSAEDIVMLPSTLTPQDYLNEATGFTSANSLSDCTPGQPIRLCTSTSSEFAKCGWLREAARAYGVEPNLSCMQAKSTSDCLKVVQEGAADVVVIRPDLERTAQRDYGLKAVLYEFSNNIDNLVNVVATVRMNSSIKELKDLAGHTACFPRYEGVGWTTMIEVLRNNSLLSNKCPRTKAVAEFFSGACVPRLEKKSPDYQEKLRSLCPEDHVDDLLLSSDDANFHGETGAFRCLASGKGDVAFIDFATIRENTGGANRANWAVDLVASDFRTLCLGNATKNCYLSWATPGQIMIKANTGKSRRDELYITLLQLENLFGKRYKTLTPIFQIFGSFNEENNVLFQDSTHRFETYEFIQRDASPGNSYEQMITKMAKCSAGPLPILSMTILLVSFLSNLV